MNADSLDVLIRPFADDDISFVSGSWISCLWNLHPCNNKKSWVVNPWHCIYDKNWFTKAQENLIRRLLAVSECSVACDTSHHDEIYGYIVHGPKRTLHWIFVKSIFRRAGVATRLLNHAFDGFSSAINITFETPAIVHHFSRWNLRKRTYAICEALNGK